MEAQDSIEKLKAEENITELTLKNSVISESNIRLQKEKEELSAVVDSIKNKLTEFSLNLPIPTAEKGSSGGTGEDGYYPTYQPDQSEQGFNAKPGERQTCK